MHTFTLSLSNVTISNNYQQPKFRECLGQGKTKRVLAAHVRAIDPDLLDLPHEKAELQCSRFFS